MRKLRSLYLSDKVSGPMTQKEIYEEILTKSCPFRKIDVEADLPFTDTKDWEKSGDEVEWTFRDMENGVKKYYTTRDFRRMYEKRTR